MTRALRFLSIALLLAALMLPAPARAQSERATALDHLGRGVSAFRGGDMTAAAQQWSEAIRLARLAHAPEVEAEALARRGEMYRTQGYLGHAGDDLRAALARAEAVGNDALVAATSGALGNLEMAARHLDAAEPLLQRSRDLSRRIGDWKTLASSENDLGNLYAQTSRQSDAAAAYHSATASAAAAGDETLVAAAETNGARLALDRGDTATGTKLLGDAVGRLERLPPSYSQGMGLLSAGAVALEHAKSPGREQTQLAERALRAGDRTAGILNNPAMLSLAQGSLGRLYARTGRTAEASHATDRALFAAQKAPAPELSFRWDWQQARLARQQNQTEISLANYRRAVAELETVRPDIPVEYRDGRSSYRVTFGPLYKEFADLLLRRATADPARAASLIREARDTIEQLKESELQDYFRDSCVTSFQERRQSIDRVAPGAAVIYPIALPDRLELLVSFGSEQQQVTVPVQEAALRAEVQQFRSLLEKRTTNEYLVPARQLYERIIRPVEPLLARRGIDTIVLVPDDVLRVIPFAALHDGSNFLIQRYAVAVVPSMHLIDPKPLAAGPRLALVLGVSQGVQGFVELPNVSNEVAAVSQIQGGRELVNEAFTQSRFAGELKSTPYNIVHVASHGQFSGDPKQTFVLAYDGKLNMDALEADIKYGERRQNALELLVLSACETATGDDRAALGLAGIALKAGARSALASLWYVNDIAAGRLVVDFYRAMQGSGVSKAQALRAAQRAMLADPRYAHPAYWAPFLLIGNWL